MCKNAFFLCVAIIATILALENASQRNGDSCCEKAAALPCEPAAESRSADCRCRRW